MIDLSDNCKAALDYAARRIPVFPIINKVPLLAWGTAAVAAIDACDPALIEMWWRCTPDALIATPTGSRSGIDVLDVDRKNNKNGFDTLELLGRSILPETPMAHTPNSGLHLYFSHGHEIRNSTGKTGLGLGLDVRGDGGLVVLPSPVGGYFWDPHLNLDTVALYPAPAWLGYRPEKSAPATSSRPAKPPSPPPPAKTCPISGTQKSTFITSAAAEYFLDKACESISAAVPGQRHAIIIREVYSIAKLIAADVLDEHHVAHRLEAAVTAMVASTGGNASKAARDFRDAWAAGRNARRAA